jgi:Ca2+-binding RTX toxin-like protein
MATINGTAGDDFLAGTPGDDDIHGFDGNDGLIGFEGNDLLDGGDGHDFMRGRQGNDQMFGGDDDDYLDGGDGDDLLDGGSGIDRVSYAVSATAGVIVDLNIVGIAQDTGQGFDTLVGIEHLSGTIYDDILIGDGGANWLWGGSDGSGVTGNDTISAGGGNDLVWVGTGNHSLDGGTGSDTLSFFGNATDITLTGVTVSLLLQGATQDTEQGMMLLTGFENLSGSLYDDSLAGDGNGNILLGDIGNDQLFGGAGNDTLYGDGRTSVDTHDTGGSGPIVTYADVSLLPFAGAPGDDVLEGGAGDDMLDGGGGSDTASYASSTGEVFFNLPTAFADDGMGGTDTLINIENFLGGAFNDFARGDSGVNVLTGGAGHDFMRGMDGNDTMVGGDDDDYLDGGQGNDVLSGGSGWDRATYAPSALAGVTVDLNIVGVAQATGQGNDTLSGIEHVSGTRFNDILTGDGGDNWIWGGSDGSGVTGNDILNAGGGNDLVQVGTGTHSANGGAGVDTFQTHGNGTDVTAAGVTISLALQGMAQDTEQGMMTLTGFENLSGSTFDDVLGGNNGANLLAGDVGSDSIDGGDGNDTLYGDGRVIVDHHGTGGSGPIVTYTDVAELPFPEASANDILNGGKGGDILLGGGGDDVLTGGKGNDTFVFGPGDGDDRITDFEKNKDTIFFDGIAGVDDFGDLTFTKIGSDVLVTWGTTDSVLLEGVKLNQIHAGDFMFG